MYKRMSPHGDSDHMEDSIHLLNNYNFMFMGDAGVDKEKDILERYNISNIDVLKVRQVVVKVLLIRKIQNTLLLVSERIIGMVIQIKKY